MQCLDLEAHPPVTILRFFNLEVKKIEIYIILIYYYYYY